MYDKAKVKKLTIIAVLAFLILIAIVAILFVISTLNSNEVVYDEEMSVFKESDIENIRERAKAFIRSYGLTEKEVNEAKIVIRKGSVKTRVEDYDGAVYASFIIDISNPKVTYKGSLMVGGSEEELFLVCPELSLAQDPDVFCVGHDGESTIDVALGDYLPYDSYEEGDSNMTVSMEQDFDDKGWPYLNINVGACEDGSDGDTAREFVNTWIREKGGVNPDIIPKKFHYVDCSGDMYMTDDADDIDDSNFSWR